MELTAHTLVDAYSRWDIEAIMAPRAEDCVHQLLPLSLGRKPMNNSEYRKYFTMITPLFQDFTARAETEVYDEAAKRLVIRLWTRASTSIGQHVIENACFLTMNDDGTKVVRFEEMAETEANGKFYAEAMALRKASSAKKVSDRSNALMNVASRSSTL